MTLIEERPELSVHSTHEAQLHIEPTDISFHDLPEDKVRIFVTVHNDGLGRSRLTSIRLESAPLGAFVPWQPLTTLSVPALEPGESRELTADVARPRPAPLGDFDRIPPKRLLTAVNSPDQPSPARPRARFMTVLDLLRRGQPGRMPAKSEAVKKTSLAPDLWDLLGRGQPHWAGNINVFVANRPVERHLARALRIYPGRTNLAMFVVGDPGRRDAYAFELIGLNADWKAELRDVSKNSTLLVDSSEPSIQELRWVESNGSLMVILATRPPADCRAGNLEVHVTRRSCETTAVVEFNLDPMAQGTGCYFL